MAKYQPARGTHDQLPHQKTRFMQLEAHCFSMAGKYGIQPVATPIFENAQVFLRSLGETSDIIGKEMYVFEDKGGDLLCLRPEGTAAIARSVVSNSLTHQLPLKWAYAGPMFRRERPQKGRTRQFHQFGIEIIGGSQLWMADLEAIVLASRLLQSLPIGPIQLEINSLGDAASRQAFRDELIKYLTPHRHSLSADSQERLDKNPLRILDSKDSQDQLILANGPQPNSFLNEASKSMFNDILAGLDLLNIEYQINPKLVRGLDYYNHVVFEFTTQNLGAQATVLAGGRYDGLLEQMGGPSQIPSVGWALGLERLELLLAEDFGTQTKPPIFIVSQGIECQRQSIFYADQLRQLGHWVEVPLGGNMSKQLSKAAQTGSEMALIVGEEELAKHQVTVKNLLSKEQKTMTWQDFLQSL